MKNSRIKWLTRSAFGCLGAVALAATVAAPASAELIYGVTSNNFLISFDSNDTDDLLSGSVIRGLENNETIQGIDFRPATGELYGIGSFSNLYTLDIATGHAALVGSGFTPWLNGSGFGFDFDPTLDHIRNVSNADQNLVLNPGNGTAAVATNLFYAPGDPNAGENPNIVHAAYTNSFAGATATQLYGIDSGLDVLVIQDTSTGSLQTVGSLGQDITTIGGFDISGTSGLAYIAYQDAALSPGRSTFAVLDLATGQILSGSEIAGGQLVTAITVVPEPTTLLTLALPATLALLRRRRA